MTTRTDSLNPTLWAMLGIPAATVIASAFTLYLAIADADPELPSQFAVEGKQVDDGFARAEAARHAGVRVTLTLDDPGILRAQLASRSPIVPPETLTLRLTHATRVDVDRHLELRRHRPSGEYSARLDEPLPAGHWWIEIEQDHEWRLRGRLVTPSASFELGE